MMLLSGASCRDAEPKRQIDARVQPGGIRAQRQAALNAIADRCHMPRDVFRMHSDDEVEIRPKVDGSYEGLDCILRKIKTLEPQLKFGFVGNEAYIGNEQ
jgi:hypothetical protein